MGQYKGQVIVSSEKQFVYRDSENRGHVQLPNMVVSCLELSDTSKIAYGVISKYVFENGREAFPAVSRIAMACNCTKKTAIKYIDELCEKGFILKERNGNRKTNSYYLMDIDKIDHLHVSEMFWWTVNSVYKEVEVCLYEDVYECFIKMLEKLNKEGIIFREIPVDAETESHIRETLLSRVKKEGDDMFNPPYARKAKPDISDQPATKEVMRNVLGGTVEKAGNLGEGKSRFSLPDDIDRWKNDNFVQYFYEKFIDATGRTHETARSKHRGMIGRLLKKVDGNKALIKLRINAFFEIGYDNQSLEWFCTSGRAAEIDLFVEKGKKPFYIAAQEKKEMVETTVQTKSGMSAEDFLKRIKGGN
ncbi:helix-turn-helix domain-containing protein [Paenibacillus sp. BIC5C1]|uniref:helix-turn-helix domain-containing protein n=1 Tax=Paenibacillus sp. BIC5C1 TaxID=3078263 RepID=UPI0028E3C31D|nr:helix-turn-helix domain-containing protein [Paenibacillus sp. BIC5C1]